MAEIPEIRVRSLSVPEISNYLINPSQSLPNTVPVTVNIGFPVVDLPGCVEAHQTNNAKNNQIVEDDSRGVLTFCDGQVPSFNPINFNEEVELPTPEAPVPTYKSPEIPAAPEIPKNAVPKVEKKEVPCPGPNAPRIGDIAQSKKKKFLGMNCRI